MLNFSTITLAAAQQALAAALERAAQEGLTVSVAVVGRAGNLRAFANMDGAFSLSGQIAQDKAYTVMAAGGAPTKALEGVVASDPIIERLLHVDPRVLPIGGGVAIVVDGQPVGAIGVSGAPTADRDHDIAEAAVAAVSG